MSTITATTPKGLVDAILAHLPSSQAHNYSVQFDSDRIVIDLIPEQKSAASDSDSVEQRRMEMKQWLADMAVPGVGLSDYAVSREAIYSPDE